MSAYPESECIAEEELLELFRPRRSDPESFAKGVERKIEAARQREEAGRAKPPTRMSSWMRRVAAYLPFDALGGSLGGSAAGKAIGAKFLPTAPALPAILMGTVLGGFVATARSLRRSAAKAVPPDAEPTGKDAWRLRTHRPTNRDLQTGEILRTVMQFGSLLLFMAIPVIGGTWAIDALFIVFLAAMLSLVFSMRGFASAGLLTQTEVSRLCISMLLTAFMGSFLWMGVFNVPDVASELGVGWSAGVLLLGIPLCLVASRKRRKAAWTIVLATPFVLFFNPLGWTRSSPEAIREQLASIDLDPSDLANWSQAMALHQALAEAGSEVPVLARLRPAIEAAIDAEDKAHPWVWTSAFQLGLIDEEHRSRLAQEHLRAYRLRRMQTGTGPLRFTEYDEYLFWLLRGEDGFPRELIADRIEASWPEEGEHGALGTAQLYVRAMDLIGCPERTDALRERVHRLLATHWIADEAGLFGRVGGFSADPEQYRTSFDEQTWFAVQLMERLGVPPEIDLRLLRGHLRAMSRVMIFDIMPELKAHSRASLLLLEEGIGMPPRSGLQRLLDERLLVATLLLVALCLIAIRVAPSAEGNAERGALP